MKQIKRKDLKIGDIFVAGINFNFINKEGTKFSLQQIKRTGYTTFHNESGGFSYNNLRKATPEEKHWLEVCIAANSFISYNEAMKTFIPEYVEAISNKHSSSEIIGTIYKTSELPKWVEGHKLEQYWKDYMFHYKPSTKEAYDAQFITKEPEFVLPEKWCVKVTSDNNNFINSVRDRSCTPYTYITSKLIVPGIKNSWLCKMEAPYEGFTEITLEEFKKYVLEEQLEEPKDKVLASMKKNLESIIHTVESSEGAIYQLGDKITVFTKDSPNKGKVFTIKGFRWNNAKTNICAITKVHSPNGIGLDKIELYVEPKVKIVEDFKLPKTWWITIKNERQLKIAKQYFSQHLNSISKLSIENTVGFVKSIYLSQPLFATNILPSTKQTNPQITFEQFEQYVLHNGFKVGDIISNGNRIIYDLQYIDGHSVAFYKYAGSNNTNSQCRILTKNI